MVETTTVHLKLDINHQRNHLWINEIGTGYCTANRGKHQPIQDEIQARTKDDCKSFTCASSCCSLRHVMFPRLGVNIQLAYVCFNKKQTDEDVRPRVSTSETLLTFIHIGWLPEIQFHQLGQKTTSWCEVPPLKQVMCCHFMKINQIHINLRPFGSISLMLHGICIYNLQSGMFLSISYVSFGHYRYFQTIQSPGKQISFSIYP